MEQHWGLGLQHVDFRGHGHPVPGTSPVGREPSGVEGFAEDGRLPRDLGSAGRW